MCGFAGIVERGASRSSLAAVEGMAAALRHRGPDDAGRWTDADAGVALGHRRLAVLELSAAGHQPMQSESGRYVIVFNGEVYNHRDLRGDLEPETPAGAWRGHSDTETLLECIDRWGIEVALSKASGMFAFALWDRRERILTLARDRIGEKPLYYGWQGTSFLFGSELKALRAHPAFRAEIDRDVLARYLLRGYIDGPRTIYAGIYRVMPGTFLQLSPGDGPAELPVARTYWSLAEVAARGCSRPFRGSDEDAVRQLDWELSRGIALQNVADVPIGAFLSGGIDSSVVVALMQSQATQPVRTFTIGFHEPDYNEAGFAAAVARVLGTEHTEAYVTPAEAMAIIPALPDVYDEPFGDSSAIATILVSRLARRHVTVSLSGDGGDELFAGYTRYRRTSDAWSLLRWVPHAMRSAAAAGLRQLCRRRRGSLLAWKADRLALYLAARNAAECYRANITQGGSGNLVIGGEPARAEYAPPPAALADVYSFMMYTDSLTYLPDDILVKVDRAAMSTSLESRVPLLDHRVVEFAWSLPPSLKIRNGRGKWLLRKLLHKYLPDEMIDRPKMGFGVPVGIWIRGPLREWAEDLLSADTLRADGLLDPEVIRAKWSRYLQGGSLEGDSMWHILMFQAWLSSVRRSRTGAVDVLTAAPGGA